jgi:hypothetical protein
MITVAEVQGFATDADEVLSSEEREALTDFLAFNPLAGEVIPDTDGVRRLKWPAASQGRRSGARVIYFFRDLNMPVYLLALYRKGERMILSELEKREIRRLVNELVETYGFQKGIALVSDGAA